MCRRPSNTPDFTHDAHEDTKVTEPTRKASTCVFKVVCAIDGCGFAAATMRRVREHHRLVHNPRRIQLIWRQQESLLRHFMPMMKAHDGYVIQTRPTLAAECLISHDVEDVGVTHEVTPLLIVDYPGSRLRVIVETTHLRPGQATRTVSNDLVKITEVCATMYTNGHHADVCWIKLNLGTYTRGGAVVQTSMKERAAKLHALLQMLPRIPKACGEWGVGIGFLFYDCDTDGTLELLCDAQISSDMRSHIKYWMC